VVITAKFASVCPCCNGRIQVGSQVEWSKGAKAKHVACPAAPAASESSKSSASADGFVTLASGMQRRAGAPRRSRSRGYGGPLAGGRWADGTSGYYSSGQYDDES
jgi:hypothetical protein